MSEIVTNLFWIFGRYLHVVATTFLLGGTLFYEFVVPMAIGELKSEQQLSVYARMRWIFRRIVYVSAVILVLTSVTSTIRNWSAYNGDELTGLKRYADESRVTTQLEETTVFGDPKWLWGLHAVVGTLTIVIAVLLVRGGTPPKRPRPWMRLNIVLLLVAIFLASATRNARLRMFELVQFPPLPPTGTDSEEQHVPETTQPSM